MSCFRELQELEDQGIDLIEILGQDSHLESPQALQELIARLGSCGDLHSELLHYLTHRRFSAEQARSLWRAIMKHRKRMSQGLGRRVKFRVAALDYLYSDRGLLRNVRLIAKPELDSILSFVNVDDVTNVYNRRFFNETLSREFHRSQRYDTPLSLLILDLDDFKLINEGFGHMEGDVVLRKVGNLLNDSTRQTDVVCRYGGDEFAIILPQSSCEDAKHLAGRVQEAISGLRLDEATCIPLPWRLRLSAQAKESERAGSPQLPALSSSVGGATYPDHCDELEELVALADQMCLEAKRAGKNQVRISREDWKLAAE